LFFKQLA